MNKAKIQFFEKIKKIDRLTKKNFKLYINNLGKEKGKHDYRSCRNRTEHILNDCMAKSL